GIAATAYQVDNDRLPQHAQELNTGNYRAEQFKANSAVDLRSQWLDYMTTFAVFTCPMTQEIDITEDYIESSTPDRIFAGYTYFGGYYSNNSNAAGPFPTGPDVPEAWIDLDDTWTIAGNRYEVLGGDQNLLRGRFDGAYLRANHVEEVNGAVRTIFRNEAGIGSFHESTYQIDGAYPEDYLEARANYVFKDGSASGIRNNDERMELIGRTGTQGFWKYLLPKQ
ncbi:MAG: hypothetical protein AAGL98_02495, partial [Planctomycetota bacterium]